MLNSHIRERYGKDRGLLSLGKSCGLRIVKPSFLLFTGISCLVPLAIAQPSPAPAPAAETKKPYKQPPPKLDGKSLPEVKEWLKDTRGEVIQRSHKAYEKGPDALEKLAMQFQTAELKDEDGRYTTPLFFRSITGKDAPRTDEFWGDYQKRLFAEWRKRFPDSKAAVLAEGRMYLQLARAIRMSEMPNLDPSRKWELALEHYATARKILNECRELQSKDPAWATSYLPLLDDLGEDKAEFDKDAAQLFKDFPDCGFAMSRAIWRYRGHEQGMDQGWEIGLRKQLAALPPDVAAKAYALTFAEIVALQGFYDSAPTGFTLRFDKGMLTKGLDLLLAEYPDSPMVASANIGLSAHTLLDHKRTHAAVKHAKGRLDFLQFKDEYWYKSAVTFSTSIAWDPKAVGLPEIHTIRLGIPPEITARMEKAAAEGPRGLEELIQHFRSREVTDKDGNHNSVHFFNWFNLDLKEMYQHREFQRKRKLLTAWKAEFPDSPFARLAAANHGIEDAWDARSDRWGSQVQGQQWEEFARRLKTVREDLEASRELQASEPAWSVVASTYCLGSGDDELFAEVSAELFRNFPECDDFVQHAGSHFMPKWGGRPGSWEPWLREMLKDHPEDVRAMGYARGVLCWLGYIRYSASQKEEMLGSVKLDEKLLKQGITLLREKYPDSNRIANMEAMWSCKLTDDYNTGYRAMQRMNGTLDMEVWHAYDNYDRSVRHVTWKKSQEK